MISVIQHIQYLIATRDCVIVPGLGAFVARYVPASFISDGTSITAPSRELSFNESLTHDDGTLTASITRREGVSYECARNAVEQEVSLINRRLQNEGCLNLPRIGQLSLTSHGAKEFTPDVIDGVVSMRYSGLSAIDVTPLISATAPAHPLIMAMDSDTASGSPVAKHRFTLMPALRYAVAATVLIGACLALLTPISPTGLDLASLQPASFSAPAVEKVTFAEPDSARYANRKIVLYRPDPAEATAKVAPKPADDKLNTPVLTHRYYLIVASTTSLKEARRYVKAHSTDSTPLYILPSDGRYRVYSASGNDFDHISALRTATPGFAAKNPNAWVYTLKK